MGKKKKKLEEDISGGGVPKHKDVSAPQKSGAADEDADRAKIKLKMSELKNDKDKNSKDVLDLNKDLDFQWEMWDGNSGKNEKKEKERQERWKKEAKKQMRSERENATGL